MIGVLMIGGIEQEQKDNKDWESYAKHLHFK